MFIVKKMKEKNKIWFLIHPNESTTQSVLSPCVTCFFFCSSSLCLVCLLQHNFEPGSILKYLLFFLYRLIIVSHNMLVRTIKKKLCWSWVNMCRQSILFILLLILMAINHPTVSLLYCVDSLNFKQYPIKSN